MLGTQTTRCWQWQVVGDEKPEAALLCQWQQCDFHLGIQAPASHHPSMPRSTLGYFPDHVNMVLSHNSRHLTLKSWANLSAPRGHVFSNWTRPLRQPSLAEGCPGWCHICLFLPECLSPEKRGSGMWPSHSTAPINSWRLMSLFFKYILFWVYGVKGGAYVCHSMMWRSGDNLKKLVFWPGSGSAHL